MNNKKVNYETVKFIQEQIGYTFKKTGLLCQAFTRKSYTEENKNEQHNEVLEFYGDKALDFVVMKKMSEYYGKVENGDVFVSSMDEGILTDIKKKLVCREMLASKIRENELQYFLLMGKGDVEQEIRNQESVQEDLFEAILGAVAIDSGWNIDALTTVVDQMLNPEFYFKNGFDDDINYVDFVQQWCQKKYGELPIYDFPRWKSLRMQIAPQGSGNIQCNLCIMLENDQGRLFEGLGQTKKEARMSAAKKAYEFILEKELVCNWVDEIGEADKERAINQLQELYQKGYIDEPKYEFERGFDTNGNPIWVCHCYAKNHRCWMSRSSKKEAKKAAAFEILDLILNQKECVYEVVGEARQWK